jgi:hypothetical protein
VGFVNEIIDMQGITTVPAIVIGDHVFVAGDRVQGIIRAYGIQKTVKVN